MRLFVKSVSRSTGSSSELFLDSECIMYEREERACTLNKRHLYAYSIREFER